jgi:hypothetical protein
LSAPVRFLAIVVIGWTGVRAMTLGALPGFTVSYAKPVPASGLPPIVATRFPALPPVDVSQAPQVATAYPAYPGYPAYSPIPLRLAYYVPYQVSPAQAAIPPRPAWQLPSSSGLDFAGSSGADSWQLASLAAFPNQRSRPAPPIQLQAPVQPRFDRVQLSSWALLRGPSTAGALASGGTLGGSQAGARLSYNFNRWLAASLRTTTPVGGSRGAEAAAGVRFTPFRSIPVSITAERRQGFGHGGGGRSAFALFAEGGLYRRPMPWRFSLDAYVQAGIVGLRSRDYFADGAFSLTRPIWGRVSAGFGMWGGVQPGLYRVDAGPRISVRVRDNIYAHADWRQRLVGSAQPSSGPALTLAADF